MSCIKFKIFQQNVHLKNLDVVLNINVTNWKEYRSTINEFKKNVNQCLTTLVDQEKDLDHDTTNNEDSAESSEDDNCKRESNSPVSLERCKLRKV
ncbi:hypothetical protein NQ315_009195 [Exocentrus adspersus]|uniref:Uncharacterized protein n=1 Tax=Exocentrus adspersus TaxID=1586481 RepID=A0AAV8WGV9_9CUCU|nr:hypothetical protein NQ315_009195 [Exocentrus adspersus]